MVILGASPDTVEAQAAFKAKYHLPFILLADADHAVAERYGVWDHWKLKNKRGEDVEYEGIYRTTFIIDENGKVTAVLNGIDAASHSNEVLARL